MGSKSQDQDCVLLLMRPPKGGQKKLGPRLAVTGIGRNACFELTFEADCEDADGKLTEWSDADGALKSITVS